jgi:hypothetical protein
MKRHYRHPGMTGIVLFLAVGGCAEGPPAALPTEEVTAGFPAHGIADTIVVNATDRQALHQVELVAPDGSATPAADISVTPSPTVASSQQVANDPYGGNLFGVGNVNTPAALGLPAGGATQTQTQLSLMVSTADIPLPDAVAYRRGWTGYRIRLVFGIPPNTVTRDIPAPAPP